jgi:hypothetical protein
MLTDRQVSHIIATKFLGWGYSRNSDTYWYEFGCQVGTAESFNPLTDEYQGTKVINDLELPCTLETLREYILSLNDFQIDVIRTKYTPKKLKEVGIRYVSPKYLAYGKINSNSIAES